ncbi:MAG TPA: cupredoxin domain-containing protein [Candidatus Limnocylindria bacterium]|nr:cupredoxin domain-containing protein [Candidatus Limnocylindria bacterium]
MHRMRALAVALLLLLALAATGCSGAAAAERVVITIAYSAFVPRQVTVPAGVPVTFVLVNEDPIDHEWIVGDEAVHAAHRTGTEATHGGRPTEVSVVALSTVETTVTFPAAGRYPFICHLPGHEAYGMVGLVTVE